MWSKVDTKFQLQSVTTVSWKSRIKSGQCLLRLDSDIFKDMFIIKQNFSLANLSRHFRNGKGKTESQMCDEKQVTNIIFNVAKHLTLLIYWLTYLLTPWCRVFLEKLTGFLLVKNLPAFYGARRLISTFKTVRHLSISWARSIQSMPTIPLP